VIFGVKLDLQEIGSGGASEKFLAERPHRLPDCVPAI
jgi:hypothetical protein